LTPELPLSLAALCVSIWAIVSSKRTASAQNRLQEQFLPLETARERDRLAEATSATLVAELYRRERLDGAFVRVGARVLGVLLRLAWGGGARGREPYYDDSRTNRFL